MLELPQLVFLVELLDCSQLTAPAVVEVVDDVVEVDDWERQVKEIIAARNNSVN